MVENECELQIFGEQYLGLRENTLRNLKSLL